MHCSSLGEFEQGRPVLEALRMADPGMRLLLTFFSPSGYEVRKGYAGADHVCYLPLDTPGQARRFLDIVQPQMAIFVKYDLWLNVLDGLHRRGVPVVLISALVRPESRFLRSMLAPLYRKAFARMRWIFTQDEESRRLLHAFCGNARIQVAGDTRFDRAAELAAKWEPVPGIGEWVAGRQCVVAGSPWPADEDILLPVIGRMRRADLCWIIAPHEIDQGRIAGHVAGSSGKMARHSMLAAEGSGADVLWIDNVGMLNRLYRYGQVAYIGGGFGSGIHNTQEAAVQGCPVLFGPKHEKFQEAVDLVARGGALVVRDAAGLEAGLRRWLEDAALLARTQEENRAYMSSKAGATKVIMDVLASGSGAF